MNQKEKKSRLKKILSSGKRLLIFNHFNPDPDSFTASLILTQIAKHFKVKSKIVYSGNILYPKNLAMLLYLHLNIHPYTPGEEENYDLIASVDTQKGMSNNSIPEHVFPQLTFDHHPLVNRKKFTRSQRSRKHSDSLNDIRIRYGSASSILLEYYLDLGLKLTSKIATAFCYTITAETNHFTRKYNEVDIHFYRKALQKANLRLISKIENTKRPVYYFQVLNRVLSTYKQSGNLLTCSLGEISNLDFLHELANFMLSMDGIEFVAITGIGEGVSKVCCRSINPQIHLGKVLQESLEGIGNGGGHETMAAGEFHVNEEKVIQTFKSCLKKFNKKRK